LYTFIKTSDIVALAVHQHPEVFEERTKF